MKTGLVSSVLINQKQLYTRSEEGSIQILRVFEKVLKSSWKIMKCSLEWLSKVLQSSVEFPRRSDVVLSFTSLYFFTFSRREPYLFTRQVKVQIGKGTVERYSIKGESAVSGGKKTTLPSISSLIGRAFSIFRQKMDGPYPSEMDIEVSIPAPTLLFTVLQKYSVNGKRRNISLIVKMD